MVRPNRLIRRIAAGSVRFDPNAIDGDGDGIVQELTPFERPAPPRKPRTLGGAMSSPGPNVNEIIDTLIADPSLYDLAPKKIPSVIYDLAGGNPELFEKMRLRGLPTIGRRKEKDILELVSEITIEPSNDGIFTIIAPPVPEIRELIDFDGTYKHVRIPDSAGRIRMYKDILSNTKKIDFETFNTVEQWSENAYDEIYDTVFVSRQSYVEAKEKLGSLYVPGSSLSSFDEMYERFLRFPSDLFFIDEHNQMEYIQVLHDVIGHLGSGRGFDRHGEWANHLALIHFFEGIHKNNPEILQVVPWLLFQRVMIVQLRAWEEADIVRGVPTAQEALSLLKQIHGLRENGEIVDGSIMRQIVGAYDKSVFNPQQTKTATNTSKEIKKRAIAYIHSFIDNNITETKTSHASFASAAPSTPYKEKSLRRFERFDPNARDGDGDGLVQELTPFERPASPGQQRRLGGQMGGLSSTAKKLEESEISDIPEIRKRFEDLDEMAKTIDKYRVRNQKAPQMPNNNITFNWENDDHRQYFIDNLKILSSPYQQHWKDKEYTVRKNGTVTSKFDKTVKKFVDALGFRLVFRGQHPSVVDSYGNGIGTFATTGSPSVDEWIIQMILTRLAEKTNPKFWELQYQQWIRNPFNVIKDGNKTVGLRKFYNNNDEEMRNAFRNLIADFYDAAMEAYGNDTSTSPQGDYQRPSDYGDVQNIDDLLEKFNYIKSALDKAIKDLTTDGDLVRSADRAAYLVRLQLQNQGFETPDNVVINGENLVAYMKKNSPDTLAKIMGDRDNFEQLDPYPSFDEDDLEVYRAFINDIEPTESELRNFISQAIEQDYIEQIDIARLIAEVLEENNKPRPEIITRMLGGGMSISPPRELQSRAKKLGVDLDSTMSLEDADNDVRWSSNSWSYKKNKVQKAADAVIVRKNKNGEYEVLMIGRKTAPFTTGVALPGGLVDAGENFRQTADREMAEETGIEASQAINSRYLGEIEARDWDTRFVRGVYVGATRYDVPENTSATAMSDAKNVRWIPVRDLADGKHRIAFGHAAWLAEAFSDDKELNEKFKLLLHASRLRNQELIRRVNKKRQKDGKELFTQLGNPSENYEITIDGNIQKPSKQKIELALEKDSDIAKDLATMVQRNRGVIPRLAENMLLFRSQNSLAETAQEYGLPEAETQRLIDMYAKRIDSVMKQRLARRAQNKRKTKKPKEPTLGGGMSSIYALGGDEVERAVARLNLNNRQKEAIRKQTLNMNNLFRTGEIYDMPLHPLIDDQRRELLDSIRITTASTGLPMIVAKPNPLLENILTVKRNWEKIELPEKTSVKEALEEILNRQNRNSDTGTVGEKLDKIGEVLREALSGSNKINDYIRKKILENIGDKNSSEPEHIWPAESEFNRFGKIIAGYDSFIQDYYNALRNPRKSIEKFSRVPDENIHDIIGHWATGRAYDRHGEWANYLAMKDLIDDKNIELTESERQALHRLWLSAYGILQLSKRGDLNNTEIIERGKQKSTLFRNEIIDYDGDIRDVVRILDSGKNGINTRALGGAMSSGGKKITETPASKIVKISLDDSRERLKSSTTRRLLGGAMSWPELDPQNLDDDSLLDYMNSLRSLMGEDAWNNDQAGEDAKKIIQRLISSRGEMSQYEINRALIELDAIAEDYYDYFDDVDLSDDLIDSFDYGAEEYDRQQQEWQEYLEYLKTKDPEEYEYWNSRDISNSLLENPEQDSEKNKEWNKRRVNPPQQPSLFDDIDVNKKVPAKKRKKKGLRKIFGRRAQDKNKKFFNTERYYGAEKVKQRAKEQLEQFREWKKAGAWNALHAAHYDWWMFPVDRGSMAYGDGYNVAGKNRKELMKDKEFMSNLREAIDIYAEAMGWDLEKSEWRDDLDWDGGQDPRAQAYGARLYKIARSAQVFGLDDEFESIYAMVQSLRSIPEIRKRIGKNDYWDNPDVPINEVTPGTNRINRRVGISNPVSKSKNKKKLGGGMAPPRSPSTNQNSNDNSRKLRSIKGMSTDDWFILFDELSQNLSDINSGQIKVPASVKTGIMRLISLLADLEPETKTYNNILVHMSDMDVIQIRKAIKQILDADFDIYGLLQFQKIIPNKQTPMLAE